MPPDPAPDEQERLRTLSRYAVLDTPPEQALDDLTTLAAAICEAPIALISLVDSERQWFKSRVGLEITETPRTHSFCIHALREPEILLVPDATLDARFAQNPLVTGEPHIRFYAGAQLTAPNGAHLGALCVMDRVPRTLTETQALALRVLARQVMTHVELRRQTREVTELWQSENALRESQEQFRLLFEGANDAIFGADAETGILVECNRAAEVLMGCPRAELIGRHQSSLHPPEDVERIRALFQQHATAQTTEPFELEILRKDGRRVAVSISPSVVTIRGRQILQGIFRDITERKRLEASLRLSQFALDHAADGVFWIAPNAEILAVNESACRTLGFTREELIGKTVPEIDPNFPAEAWAAHWEELRQRKSFSFESLHQKKDGTRITTEVVVNHLEFEGREYNCAMVRDVTERRKADEAMEMMRFCVDRAADSVFWVSREGDLLYVNDAACTTRGYTREELLGMKIFDLDPDFQSAAWGIHWQHLRQRGSVTLETRHRTKDGRVFPIDVNANYIEIGGKEFNFAFCRDITKRKRAEARFQRLVSSNVQGVIFWKINGEITGANDAFLRLVGYSRTELEQGGVSWLALSPPEWQDADQRALEVIKKHGSCPAYERELLCKDGRRVPILMGAAAFEDDPHEGICFIVDLTELKGLEQQFLRSQRMESIGTLAGGIAHDLNNVLAPILMSLKVLRKRLPEERDHELLAVIESSAQHGAEMVRQILSFARGVEGRRLEIQLRNLIPEIPKIANDTFLKNIEVRTCLAEDLWMIVGDSTQIHQALLNLCMNARDAMPQGGVLTLSARNVILDAAGFTLDYGAKPGRHVLVEITDTGVGIPPEIIDRIFDPFFTTKEVGRGTGLGLSTTLAIVKSHGGFIRVQSTAGQGSTFQLHFPASPHAALEMTSPGLPEPAQGNGEMILVVDDDPSVRLSTATALRAFGYRTVEARDGKEAVATFATHAAEIALVLTDMMMPGMAGPETIRVMRHMNADIPIIAASGVLDESGLAEATALGATRFLMKPYTADTLVESIQQCLAAKA